MTGQVATLRPNAGLTTLRSLKEWALTLQSRDERIPADKAAQLPTAIQTCEQLLVPSPPELLAVEIRKLVDWAKAFNVPHADLKAATEAYREALSTIPPDLLSQAFRDIRATHKWGMRLPLPSEIANQIQDKLTERRLLLGKLQMAKLCPVEESAKATEEEKQWVTELLSQWRTNRATS